MSEERIYRNEACPCGSGRKFKKCCYNRQGKISPLDRAMAIDCLEQYVEHCDERADALTLFRAGLDVDAPAMKGDFQQASDQAFLLWFAFDYLLTDGCFVVDHALAANPLASPGERLYLEQMKQTAIAPYEVLSIRPGHSVTMRQVCGHREIEVREKTASHTLKRWDLLAVRVNPVGPTGGPEMEMGVLWLPQTMREHVTTLVQDNLQGHPEGPESIMVLKALGASLHQLWLRSIVDPQVPQIRTADSQPMVWTTLWFEVHDPARVEEMLNACRSLEAGSNYWNWIVDGTMLGTIELLGPQLTFDIPTQSQADNGRRFLEGIAGDLITHTRNEITDVTEELRRRIRNGELPEAHPDSMQEVPAKVQDELTQEYFSKYYLEWLDDSIPALDNKSPRYAAKSTRLCARLIDLLKDMENMYLRALTQGDPAFDPTWMWDELGLSDH
ncbi:MAG: SEC-C domain-containing protein, partial [Planctomycetales bacterium]|nr:SEC-C domain-containing protein [Planctomycetales bacterium]